MPSVTDVGQDCSGLYKGHGSMVRKDEINAGGALLGLSNGVKLPREWGGQKGHMSIHPGPTRTQQLR